MGDMLQSVFEEGYCEHANGDNSDRKTECMMCYQHVRKEANKMWENVDNSVDIDTSAMRRMFAMYMFCADTYLAPVYSECFEDVDDLVTHIEEANTEEWGKKLLAVRGHSPAPEPGVRQAQGVRGGEARRDPQAQPLRGHAPVRV